jgi:aryl-phospho-beta-D-glucosidase BglC (GH1 family)
MKISLLLFVYVLLSLSCSARERYNGFIKAEGTRLVDESGKEFLIRGIGLGNWLLPEGYMWRFDTERADRPRRIEETFESLLGPEKAETFWKDFRAVYITERDIKEIADEGFNTVRLPMNWRLLMEDSETVTFKPEGFEYIDNLVVWCRKYHLYIVLDLHAAPGGQTGRNIDDSENDRPELFTDPRYRVLTIALWKEIARRYKNEPVILAYDLLNEPLPADTTGQYNHLLEPLYKEITAVIRSEDPRHIITIEGANWANDWSVFGPPFDDNLLYQFHKYWDSTDIASIRPYLDFRDKYDVPVWCGETGENNNTWYRKTIRLFEKNRIGWAFWPWKKIGDGNNPRTINPPAKWSRITGYARNRFGLSPEKGEAILREYLENCRIENCREHPEVMRNLFEG